MKFDVQQVLKRLKIDSINSGAFCSEAGWSSINKNNSFAAVNPCSEEQNARVTSATVEDYEQIINNAVKAQKKMAHGAGPGKREACSTYR